MRISPIRRRRRPPIVTDEEREQRRKLVDEQFKQAARLQAKQQMYQDDYVRRLRRFAQIRAEQNAKVRAQRRVQAYETASAIASHKRHQAQERYLSWSMRVDNAPSSFHASETFSKALAETTGSTGSESPPVRWKVPSSLGSSGAGAEWPRQRRWERERPPDHPLASPPSSPARQRIHVHFKPSHDPSRPLNRTLEAPTVRVTPSSTPGSTPQAAAPSTPTLRFPTLRRPAVVGRQPAQKHVPRIPLADVLL